MCRNSKKTKQLYGLALTHFQRFLQYKYPQNYTLETVLKPLSKNQIDVYSLVDNFISYLVSRPNDTKLSPATISVYVAAVRSYFAFHDIDIVSSKFRRKVRLPKRYREDEEPIDASDIRKILLSCNNRRLKAYLLVLASSGARAVEALAIRNSDLDFTVVPTKVHIRKEFAKTRVSRDVYISDEASKFLKDNWLAWKYGNSNRTKKARVQSPEDIVFRSHSVRKGSIFPETIYYKMREEFNKVLKTIEMDERKEGMLRRKVTFHSFRRYVKTVAATQTNSDYSEWFLGHAKSPYWTMKEIERREIYATKIMKYLTFLDYGALESTGRGIESKLDAREKEIANLREKELNNSDQIAYMKSKHEQEMRNIQMQLKRIISVMRENPKLAKVKEEILYNI